MNTVLGLLAKGDQNCWMPEEQKPQNLFGENGESVAPGVAPAGGVLQPEVAPGASQQTIVPRDPNTLPPGAVQSMAEIEAAKSLAAAKAELEAEKQRLEEEERKRQEAEEKKKSGFGSKVIKWLSSFTDEE
jgi:hypothetical protein